METADHRLVPSDRPMWPQSACSSARGLGLDPRGLRHSFVSLLSDNGVSLEEIAELCGHAGTRVTEAVYRHQVRPALLNGAVAMDRIFASDVAVSET